MKVSKGKLALEKGSIAPHRNMRAGRPSVRAIPTSSKLTNEKNFN